MLIWVLLKQGKVPQQTEKIDVIYLICFPVQNVDFSFFPQVRSEEQYTFSLNMIYTEILDPNDCEPNR